MSYSTFEDQRLKHLDFIHGVINRLASNGFVLKGWAITLAAALFGVALSSQKPSVAAVALVPVAAFWCIDAYFLRSERLFRAFYDQVSAMDERIEPFEMSATGRAFVDRVRSGEVVCDKDVASWLRTALLRPIVSIFYGSLVVVTGIVTWLA